VCIPHEPFQPSIIFAKNAEAYFSSLPVMIDEQNELYNIDTGTAENAAHDVLSRLLQPVTNGVFEHLGDKIKEHLHARLNSPQNAIFMRFSDAMLFRQLTIS
jgi:hypothetical protein